MRNQYTEETCLEALADPPTYSQEIARVQALLDLNLLDTPEEAEFDSITALAAHICQVPIALISLIDAYRQWFKSHYGLTVRETPRELAFCAHAIQNEQPMIVSDTYEDPRFIHNTLVTEAPHIRFYAGVPLFCPQGYALGTLCVIDRQPRQISAEQIESLKHLATVVEALFTARLSRRKASILESLLHHGYDEVYVLDATQLKLLHANKSGLLLTESEPQDDAVAWLHHLNLALPVTQLVEELRQLSVNNPKLNPIETSRQRPGQTEQFVELRIRYANIIDSHVIILKIVDISQRKQAALALEQSESLFRTLCAFAPVGIYLTDAEGLCQYTNPAWQKMTGLTAEQALGSGWTKAVHPADRDEIRSHWVLGTQQSEAIELEFRFRKPDGANCWVQSHARRVLNEDGSTRGFVGINEDITERRLITETLFEQKEHLRVTLESIGDGVITTDQSGCISYLNPIAESMTGWHFSEAKGKPIEKIFTLVSTANGESSLNPVQLALREQRAIGLTANTNLIRRDGFSAAIESSAAPIYDRHKRIIGAVMVFHDVSESRAQALRMAHLAQHDALTDLPNRVLLKDRLQQAISLAQRNRHHVALMFLDLDHFKKINDSYGHQLGDKLLIEVAQRLTSVTRRSDTISRQGGDEFVILLPEVAQQNDAAVIARKVLAAISAPFQIEEKSLRLTFSIGISLFPDDGADIDALMKNADTAMYRAKQSGRNNYQFFTPAIDSLVQKKLGIENLLERALQHKLFELHYQPKVNITTGELIGAEALIRFQPSPGVWFSPAEFIPIAEDCGLIIPIDEWVLAEVCRQNVAWQAMGLPKLPISINISALHFMHQDFTHKVVNTLQESGLEPAYLELELTEGQMIQNGQDTLDTLTQLKSIGVGIAIDDFGTGYSNLSYLKQLPVGVLKIDQSFVRDIVHDPDDLAITLAIISMTRSLRKRTIAEGVETLEQARLLQAHGCHEMQGYYFSKPLPATEFETLLQRSSHEKNLFIQTTATQTVESNVLASTKSSG